MSADLITEADLAAMFGEPESKVAKWRRRYGWEAIRVGRTVRYTPAQVEQIIADHTDRPSADDDGPVLTGQTARSLARSKS